MIDDPHDRRLARSAAGLLVPFNVAGVLEAADVHVAQRLGVLLGDADDRVLLAAAMAVRAVRHGSVCVDLAAVADQPLEDVEDPAALPWPDPEAWLAAVGASAAVDRRALRLEGSLVYLDRYWREEQQVCDDLLARLDATVPALDEPLLVAALDRLFTRASDAEQRAAADGAARRATTVLTGGPGTGKTTTVARLLSIVSEQHTYATGRVPRIAMCAPTAKAAARLSESVAEQAAQLPAADAARLDGLTATTLHRLLGWRPGSTNRFRHDRDHRLPHDVVVVDETSMVSLTHMARLLEALRPAARLILVGDADQLASVEAGAVLADVVRGLADHPSSPVARLRTVHRYGSTIGELAEALRAGDADAAIAVLTAGHPDVELIDPADAVALAALEADVAGTAIDVRRAAVDGDAAAALAALGEHRLLCAHRDGPQGVRGWNRRVERLVGDVTGVALYDEWYPGRPVLVTANDYALGVYNGDVGVTIRTPSGRLAVALASAGAGSPRLHAPTRLPDVETVHAMTVHKAQGSQATVVTVVMPPVDSALLTRELFYTAVTRATGRVRVVGTTDAVRAAIARSVHRASGLADRLTTSDSGSGREAGVR